MYIWIWNYEIIVYENYTVKNVLQKKSKFGQTIILI